MKKAISIIFIIALVVVCGISMTACNNATTQGQLANILRTHTSERFEYDVSDTASATKGTYSVKLQAYEADSTIENFGSATLSNVSRGVLITNVLNFDGAVYETGCYYNLISGSSFMVPAYTYRVQKQGETELFRLQGVYDGAKLNYDRYINGGEKQSGSVSASGVFYDNNQFYQSLRTITTFSTSLGFAFTMPLVSATEATSVSMSATCASTSNIKTTFSDNYANSNGETIYKENGIECYHVSLSRTTDVEGLSHTAYYAVNNITLGGWGMTHVLVQFSENYKDASGKQQTMVYSLNTAALA